MQPLPLFLLRRYRTASSNRVKRSIKHMLTEEAKYRMPNGLPSWWPFWSDCLVTSVRACVRNARDLANAEGFTLDEPQDTAG